jgi:antitoxin component of RelBE/YafQ-DinJ toxin-antitoxin module
MARNVQIHVAVRDDIKEKFLKIADRYGMTMSALASYIIGQYVYNHEKLVDPLSDDVRFLIKNKVEEVLEEEGEGRGEA